jgi:hypothetical protein
MGRGECSPFVGMTRKTIAFGDTPNSICAQDIGNHEN